MLGRAPNLNDSAIPVHMNISGVTSLRCGQYHLHFTTATNTYSRGWNNVGQLGLGAHIFGVNSSAIVPNLLPPLHYCSGMLHTVYYDINKEFYSWGSNSFGQLGLGSNSSTIDTPQRIFSQIKDIQDVSCGLYHTLVLDAQNRVYSFGMNLFSQLGHGDFNHYPSPTLMQWSLEYPVNQVAAGAFNSMFISRGTVFYFGNTAVNIVPRSIHSILGQAKGIACGRDFSHYLTKEGLVYGFGRGNSGQLGLGPSKIQIPIPHQVPLSNVSRINARDASVFAAVTRNENETLFFVWGRNEYGELGVGNNDEVYTPTQVFDSDGFIDIAFGREHTLFLHNNGTVFCAGFLYNCGASDEGSATSSTPFAVSKLPESISKIAAGRDCSFYLNHSGDVYVAGNNNRGVLGTGDVLSISIPVRNPSFRNVTLISVDLHAILVVDGGNRVVSCGSGEYGALGIGTTENGLIPQNVSTLNAFAPLIVQVLARSSVSMVLLSTGQVFAWGKNEFGQVGDQTTVNVLLPTLVQDLTNIIHVAHGDGQSLFLSRCPEGFGGPSCQDHVCGGLSGRAVAVCSGRGKCVAPNVCVCDPPSTGKSCEISQYGWKGFDGIWTDATKWSVIYNGISVDVLTHPTQPLDRVILKNSPPSGEPPSTIEVRVTNIPTLTLNEINIGGGSTSYVVIFGEMQLVLDKLIVAKGSKVVFEKTSVIINTWIIDGSVDILAESTIDVKNYGGTPEKMSIIRSMVKGGTTSRLSNVFIQASSFAGLELSGFSQVSQSIIDGNLLIKGETNILKECNINGNITNRGVLRITSDISTFSDKWILNEGNLILVNSTLALGLQNFGTATLSGRVSVRSISQLSPVRQVADLAPVTSNMIIDDCFLICTGDILFGNGTVQVSGNIRASAIRLSSPDGYMSIGYPQKLLINGDMIFDSDSTMFWRVNSSSGLVSSGDYLSINGNLQMNGLNLVRLGSGYTPGISETIPFLYAMNLTSSASRMFSLLGAPFKNMEFGYDSGIGSFKVVPSFGSVSNVGYQCHYLGNQKVLEMNLFGPQNKILLSLTVPRRDNRWIGFGFDRNGSLTESVIVFTHSNSIFEMTNHKTIETNLVNLLNMDSSLTGSIFRLPGESSRTIHLLMSSFFFVNQRKVYYAEGNLGVNQTISNSSHHAETFSHHVMLTPSLLNGDVQECTNLLQPLRAEIYHLAPFIMVLTLYIVLAILCVVFYRFIPLKTRGISPLLTLFFLFLQLLLEVKNLAEIPPYQGSLCFYYAFGIYPLQVICFIMILLYFIRYFAIINLNQNKNTIYQQIKLGKSVETTKKVTQRLLKMLSSTWFTIIILIASYVLVLIIFLIVLASDAFHCRFSTLVALRIVNNIELISIYILTIFTLLGDLIPNFKCRVLDYLFADPYYFRVQIVLFMPFMVYSLAVEIYALATSGSYMLIVQNHVPMVALNTILFSLLLVIEVLFPLVLTIWTLIRRACHKKISTNRLDDVLNKEDTKKLFVDFCRKEYSLENISCYDDIQVYKSAPMTNRPTLARDIYQKYLCGADAVMEVNVAKKVCDQVLVSIDAENFNDDLCADVEKTLSTNLSDTFSRFSVWTVYENHVALQKREKEMIEGKF